MAVRYVCTGGCGGSVSEEQYKNGKRTCGAKDCKKYGKSFDRKEA